MATHQKLFFLLLVLLPTQLGFHFWPEWGYVLGRRIDYLSPTIYLTDILIFLLIGSWMISGKLGSLGRLGKYVLFAVVLFASVNSYFAASPWVAIHKWFKVLEFAGLGWYVIKNRYRISDVRLPLTIGVLFSSALASAQFLLQRSVGTPLWLLGERAFDVTTPGIARFEGFGTVLLRPYATFPHPNVLGGYLAVLIPLLANPIVVVFGILALLVSFSRSAWIALLLGIGLTSKRLVLPSLFIVILILFRINMREESVVVRRELNSAALSMWKQSPLIGVGLGNFIVELPKQSLNRQGNFLQPAHNMYLLVLSETGIFGAILFLWVIVRGIKGAKGHWGAALMGFFIIGLVDHYPLTLQQGQLLFTLLFAFSMIQ